VAAKADGAKAGSTKAGSAKAGGAKTGSASAGFPPPPSARPSARPSPLSPPTTKKDSADEDFEVPEVSAKTKRNVIIGLVCFLAFIVIGPMLNQCSDLMTALFDDDSFGSRSINVGNSGTSNPNSNSSSSSSYDYMSVLITPEAEKRGVEDYENPVVILDEKELKITINVGSGGNRAITGYLDFECIIENKTNKTAGLFFEDISADGFSGNKYNVGFFRKESRQGSTGAFAPGENEAYLSFAEDTVFGDITSLTGRIMFFERGTGEEIKRYTLSIAML
jgi:hypothetical protein